MRMRFPSTRAALKIDKRVQQEGAYISRSKVVWAGHWDELEDHSRKDVKHRPKRGIHEGYDGAATLECFLFLAKVYPAGS